MKIQIKESTNGEDWRNGAAMYIDDVQKLSVIDLNDCPEDATLGRDLSFFYSIPNLMKLAYEAGQAGEDFEILDYISIDWEDFCG